MPCRVGDDEERVTFVLHELEILEFSDLRIPVADYDPSLICYQKGHVNVFNVCDGDEAFIEDLQLLLDLCLVVLFVARCVQARLQPVATEICGVSIVRFEVFAVFLLRRWIVYHGIMVDEKMALFG